MLFLPVEQMKIGTELQTDVYFFNSEQVALLTKGQLISKKMIDRIRQYENAGVYFKEPEMEYPPQVPFIDPQFKQKALNILKETFDNFEFISIDDISEVADELVDTIINNESILVNIMDLKSYDDYTFHHSISVAVISVAIGNKMGLDMKTLNELALCALLHDIGKIHVPKVLINKPGKLSKSEYEQVQEHALRGVTYLRDHNIDIESIKLGVVSHHERYDGTGYPLHLGGDKIPLFGRIIAVADVFDALTSKRPHRQAMPPADAAEYIMGNSNIAFDHEIVKVFMQVMEFYPPGTFVKLSTGQTAVVLKSEHPLRPVVKIAERPYKQIDLYKDSENLNITIVEVFQKISDENFVA